MKPRKHIQEVLTKYVKPKADRGVLFHIYTGVIFMGTEGGSRGVLSVARYSPGAASPEPIPAHGSALGADPCTLPAPPAVLLLPAPRHQGAGSGPEGTGGARRLSERSREGAGTGTGAVFGAGAVFWGRGRCRA